MTVNLNSRLTDAGERRLNIINERPTTAPSSPAWR
jgi:hypothetical protein